MGTAAMARLRDRLVLAGAGLAAGFVYWLAYETWPDEPTARALVAALLFFVSADALTVQLAWTGREVRRLATLAAVIALAFGLMALWVWSQIPGPGAPYRGDEGRVPTAIMAAGVALYVLLPFVQIYQRSARAEFPYPDLFQHSWNNAFILAIGGFLAAAFWLLVLLWGALFKLIGVSFFHDVFTAKAFVAMSLSTVFGYGIALGRESERITNTLRGITLAVFKTLMPLLAVIALLFLAFLPFTGLQPLWETRRASALLLTLIGLAILFFNGVYQDGEAGPGQAGWLVRATEAALVGMPIYGVITMYAVGLRIGQYGLTPERFYGVLVTIVGALYAVGYGAAVFARRRGWMAWVPWLNVRLALAVVALALLVHTPVLDPLRWSARSQARRLASGAVPAVGFDYAFLRYGLGHVGYAKLAELESLTSHREAAAIRHGVASARAADSYVQPQPTPTVALLAADLILINSAGPVPEGLVRFLGTDLAAGEIERCAEADDCVVVPVNLDDDPDAEYLVVLSDEGLYSIYGYDREADGAWTRIGRLFAVGKDRRLPKRQALLDSLRRGPVQPTAPPYRDIRIGELRLRVNR